MDCQLLDQLAPKHSELSFFDPAALCTGHVSLSLVATAPSSDDVSM